MSQSEAPYPTRIGDYEIEGLLGAGGMAKVFRAKHAILETYHAIKVLDPEYRANAEARKRFLDEAKIQAKHLDHTNIVKVTNIVATADHAALVMELIEGPSLEAHIAALKSQPAEIKRIMLGVLDAVEYAHKAGIIHRDLKPANVLLAKRGKELIPKVTDFGIAKVTATDDNAKGGKKSTHAGARMGTLSYMSPEQIRRAKDVTARSDVFSLGAMLYEMATGEMAFGGDSDYDVMENIVNGRYQAPERRYDKIDPLLALVIAKALEPDPAARFASCDEMAGALRGEIPIAKKPKPAEKVADKAPDAPVAKPPVSAAVTQKTSEKSDPAVTTREAVRDNSKRGLVMLLVIGALVLGGGAVFLATRGNGSSTHGGGTGSDGGERIADPAGSAGSNGSDGSEGSAGTVAMEPPPADAHSTANGVLYKVLTSVDGPSPGRSDTVRVRYTGWTMDGKEIDSSHGEASELRVDGLIPGFSEILMRMSLGEKYHVWIPEALAYKGLPGHPQGMLVFDIELVEIKSADAPVPTAEADASVPTPPTPEPEAVNPCRGTWLSGNDMILTVKGSATSCSGSYSFIDTTSGYPVARCDGELDGCRIDARGHTMASFACTYTHMTNTVSLGGSMSISCSGHTATARVTNRSGSARDWTLRR